MYFNRINLNQYESVHPQLKLRIKYMLINTNIDYFKYYEL